MTDRRFHPEKKFVDIDGKVLVTRKDSYLIQFEDNVAGTWVPMSQVEINDDGTVTMPEWLAMEKELI